MTSGFLLINKPKDWTSHDVVAYLRKIIGVKKIGHAGTLDPFATGLLIVGVGREATKRLDKFKVLPKTYIATLKLGGTSDTYDSTGKITMTQWPNGTIKKPSLEKINKILKKFIGKQLQTPPMYSAKKVGGKKLYELARKGVEVERQPANIEIYNIKLLEYNWPYLKIEINCSTGTYIRSLAHDIGQALGCGAYCDELERVKIGEYLVEDAMMPEGLNVKDLPFIGGKIED